MSRLTDFVVGVAGAGLAIAIALGVTIAGAAPAPGVVTTERTAVLVPSPALEVSGPCGGDTIVATLSYYPKADEHTFTAMFRADGGDGGGYVVFGMGDYEQGVDLPAGGGSNYYTITVTAPVTIYRAPLLVYMGGPCGSSPSTGLKGGTISLTDLNIFASP